MTLCALTVFSNLPLPMILQGAKAHADEGCIMRNSNLKPDIAVIASMSFQTNRRRMKMKKNDPCTSKHSFVSDAMIVIWNPARDTVDTLPSEIFMMGNGDMLPVFAMLLVVRHEAVATSWWGCN